MGTYKYSRICVILYCRDLYSKTSVILYTVGDILPVSSYSVGTYTVGTVSSYTVTVKDFYNRICGILYTVGNYIVGSVPSFAIETYTVELCHLML